MASDQPRFSARRPAEWCPLIDDDAGPVHAWLAGLYGDDKAVVREKAALCRHTVEAFAREFGGDAPVLLVRSTGRINLMGMHVDHRGGFVNPIAVGEMVVVAQPRDDDVVAIRNLDRDRFPDFHFAIRDELPDHKIRDWDAWTQAECDTRAAAGLGGHWSNYVKAAALYLQHLHTDDDGRFDPALRGMNLMVNGRVPLAAGLSSSSALVVATAEACIAINGLAIDDMGLVEACGAGEWYVGTRGGLGDHAAIKFGELDHIVHIGSFPLSARPVPFPEGYRVVLANSLKEAKKSEGARDVFNQRVASYQFALLMLQKRFPGRADRMEHLRDVNPTTLGVAESEVYRMVAALPERASRDEVRAALPEHAARLEQIFGSHAEPPDGYAIRQVALYGITECIRSALAADLLEAGDVAAFGELVNISHDGDRVTRLLGGERVAADNRLPDARIQQLVADLESGDPERVERARLWRQPGGYGVSCAELDELVDLARATDGVIGAGLVGAGLGGSMVAVVEEQHAEQLVANMAERYYQPRGLPVEARVVRPLGGSGILRLPE